MEKIKKFSRLYHLYFLFYHVPYSSETTVHSSCESYSLLSKYKKIKAPTLLLGLAKRKDCLFTAKLFLICNAV